MSINNGVQMLNEAAETIKNRQENYGSPTRNWNTIAALWSTLLGSKVTPSQAAMCLIAVKLARLVKTPDHVDSIIDIAGYAAILKQIIVDEGQQGEMHFNEAKKFTETLEEFQKENGIT